MQEYRYFDADYFMNGPSKGTVYTDYIVSSRSSQTYVEIARAIANLIRPKRVLEIGCATGVIVRYLNALGIEAHGIDVSEWAIEHREHENVQLAGAEALPFEDGAFDLVYSVHAMEHVPAHLKDTAMSELGRVCSSGFQFHMLPMVGAGPYVGDHETVIANLQKDPTHALLNDRPWWLNEFSKIGFQAVPGSILFRSEAAQVDLGHSQLLLSNVVVPAGFHDRVTRWNADVVQGLMEMNRSFRGGFHTPGDMDSVHGGAMDLILQGGWKDLMLEPDAFRIEPTTRFNLTVSVDREVSLRLCLQSGLSDAGEAAAEADAWFTFRPGTTSRCLIPTDFHQRRGEGTMQGIGRMFFGGTGEANVKFALSVQQNGKVPFHTSAAR